jgi:hypothetical protein
MDCKTEIEEKKEVRKKPWSKKWMIGGGLLLLGLAGLYMFKASPDATFALGLIIVGCVGPYAFIFWLMKKYPAPSSGGYVYPAYVSPGRRYVTHVKCESCGKVSDDPVSKVTPFSRCQCGTEYHLVDRNFVERRAR